MKINRERVEMFENNPGVLIEDLYADDGSSVGTRVILQIPL